MKRTILFTVALLITAAMFAQSGRNIYNKYSDAKDVSAVYISPVMLRLMGQLPDMEMGDEHINITSIIRTMTGFYLINSENTEINNSISSDVNKMVKTGRYEMLMEIKDNGETVHIYIVGKEDNVTSLVFTAQEEGEYTFICLDGQMSRQQLENILSDALDGDR
ncbi:MAG: DUF4252 domain-containing protein [Bacteroidaceae bacterium]|nr:DUF4252 domain-containing protein [Bacteroidaceae bacterium]